jgi:hypothetical protein
VKTQDVAVISIHPDPGQPLGLDLKEILAALEPHLQRWIWCVRNLDWLGNESEPVCRRVESAGPRGLWMTSKELLSCASGIHQTVEGDFLAFPRELQAKAVKDDELNLRAFPSSRAELAIVAVDGGFFEVYAKEPELLTRLRHFQHVRDENPSLYF